MTGIASARLLSNAVGKTTDESLALRLYGNDHTPAKGDGNEAYGEIPYANGYNPPGLANANWVITPGTPDLAEHPEITFTFSGPIPTVYGYFITGNPSGAFYGGERFAVPQSYDSGDQLKVTPRFRGAA